MITETVVTRTTTIHWRPTDDLPELYKHRDGTHRSMAVLVTSGRAICQAECRMEPHWKRPQWRLADQTMSSPIAWAPMPEESLVVVEDQR